MNTYHISKLQGHTQVWLRIVMRMVTEGNGVGVLSGMGVYKEQFSSTLTEKAGL